MKKSYTGKTRQEILFPLGGIGSGCISLDGTGRLRDWEIFNRPAKGTLNGFSHFGIKVENREKVIDARIMNSDWLGSYMGQYVENKGHLGYGYGPFRYLLSGVPHFKDSEFMGEYPLSEVRLIDETFPGTVKLEAFNPLIPSNEDDSSLPAAFFTAEVKNPTDQPLSYTFELTVNNPSKRKHVHRKVEGESFHGISLNDDFADSLHPEFGSLVIGIPRQDPLQCQQYWYRGGWYDNLEVFWQNFTEKGELHNRIYDGGETQDFCVREDLATVAVRADVAPGQTWRQRFLIGWYYPNAVNYWSDNADLPEEERRFNQKTWKNYYGTHLESAESVAEYAFRCWDRLEAETRLFHDALFSSDLPDDALEAVSANLSTLKSPTVMRLTHGEFYGFEGCQCDCGSCEGSCTHVWNYAFALPFLFPRLERSMRELDYTYNMNDDGGMPFRLQLPLGKKRSSFRPCVDGQMGGILKTYREWKISGEDQWLQKWWPKVKKSLEYAWAPTNADRWDPDQSGVITGRQHHTLDMELFGPNAWLNTFYIGALKAASEMAKAMGDDDSAALYEKRYQNGRNYTDLHLFNGEYYQQQIDIRDPHVLDPYQAGDTLTGGTTVGVYWSEEAQQLKYQIGEGCGVDQVLAQWMCELCGIGEILNPSHVESALKSIYKNNFKPSLRNHFNPCRIYGLNDESGLVICDWPQGKEKPVVPIPYAEETMHGFEYQAAVHMIMHGMEEEGMNVVRGIRRRYTGEKRNPWNEMECGSHYARSMASYGLLLAFSGFKFDMRKKRMGMLPLHHGRYFWSLDGAWGTLSVTPSEAELCVDYGTLDLREWVLPNAFDVNAVSFCGRPVSFTAAKDSLILSETLSIPSGIALTAVYEDASK